MIDYASLVAPRLGNTIGRWILFGSACLPFGLVALSSDTCLGGGIEDYIERGYIPEDLPKTGFHAHGASQTIEQAYTDWALARGQRMDVYIPRAARCGGLIEALGSRDTFVAQLEEAFVRSEELRFFAPRDDHNLVPLDFGNEPALATTHLFQPAGCSDRSQFWHRRVVDTIKSGNRPEDTWGGDEDQGIMGAWNVLVSIGLFSATGACEQPARYQVPAPLFERVTLRLNPKYSRGTSFTILSVGVRPDQTGYLAGARMNGEPLTCPESTYDRIIAGGEFNLYLSTTAVEAFGGYLSFS